MYPEQPTQLVQQVILSANEVAHILYKHLVRSGRVQDTGGLCTLRSDPRTGGFVFQLESQE